MVSRFKVSNVTQLPAAGIYAVDGTIESGDVRENVTVAVEGRPDRQVRIRGVALVNAKDPRSRVITLSIEKPSFPLDELRGAMLVGD